MPATTPNPAKGNASDSNGNGNGYKPKFVELTLTSEQKERLAQFIEETEWIDLEAWIQKRCEDGDIISIKRIVDDGKALDGYLCSVTGTRLSTSHDGKCLTARASTAVKSLWNAMYRDTEILNGIWVVTDRKVDVDI